MGADVSLLKAKTKMELRKQFTAWKKSAQKKRMTFDEWNPENVKQTEDGFEIHVRAHY